MLHINQRNVENQILYDLLYSLYKSASLKSLYWHSGYIFCFVNDFEKYSQEEVDRVLELASNISQQRRRQIISGGV